MPVKFNPIKPFYSGGFEDEKGVLPSFSSTRTSFPSFYRGSSNEVGVRHHSGEGEPSGSRSGKDISRKRNTTKDKDLAQEFSARGVKISGTDEDGIPIGKRVNDSKTTTKSEKSDFFRYNVDPRLELSYDYLYSDNDFRGEDDESSIGNASGSALVDIDLEFWDSEPIDMFKFLPPMNWMASRGSSINMRNSGLVIPFVETDRSPSPYVQWDISYSIGRQFNERDEDGKRSNFLFGVAIQTFGNINYENAHTRTPAAEQGTRFAAYWDNIGFGGHFSRLDAPRDIDKDVLFRNVDRFGAYLHLHRLFPSLRNDDVDYNMNEVNFGNNNAITLYADRLEYEGVNSSLARDIGFESTDLDADGWEYGLKVQWVIPHWGLKYKDADTGSEHIAENDRSDLFKGGWRLGGKIGGQRLDLDGAGFADDSDTFLTWNAFVEKDIPFEKANIILKVFGDSSQFTAEEDGNGEFEIEPITTLGATAKIRFFDPLKWDTRFS